MHIRDKDETTKPLEAESLCATVLDVEAGETTRKVAKKVFQLNEWMWKAGGVKKVSSKCE